MISIRSDISEKLPRPKPFYWIMNDTGDKKIYNPFTKTCSVNDGDDFDFDADDILIDRGPVYVGARNWEIPKIAGKIITSPFEGRIMGLDSKGNIITVNSAGIEKIWDSTRYQLRDGLNNYRIEERPK